MRGAERENPWIAKCHKAFTPVIDQGYLSLYDINRVSSREIIRNRNIINSGILFYSTPEWCKSDLHIGSKKVFIPKVSSNLIQLKMIFLCNFFSPSTPIRDRNRTSPYNINWISRGQVTRMKKNINKGSISWFNTKFSKLSNKNCTSDSQEYY